jgi:uncharacterized membrane protein
MHLHSLLLLLLLLLLQMLQLALTAVSRAALSSSWPTAPNGQVTLLQMMMPKLTWLTVERHPRQLDVLQQLLFAVLCAATGTVMRTVGGWTAVLQVEAVQLKP